MERERLAVLEQHHPCRWGCHLRGETGKCFACSVLEALGDLVQGLYIGRV